jgi:hypothetical protein
MIVDIITELGFPDAVKFGRSKELKELKELIINETEFLTKHMGGKERFSMRLYCIMKNITSVPLCECGRHVTIRQNSRAGECHYDSYIFSTYCSRECARKSETTVKKRTNTMTARYGDHNMRTPDGIEKFKNTMLEKYGVENPMMVDSIKKKVADTNTSRYGGVMYLNTEQGRKTKKETLLKKYGVEHPMHHKPFKHAARLSYLKTVSERYGVDHTTKAYKKHHDIFNDDAKFIEVVNEYKHTKEIARVLDYSVSRTVARMAELGVQNDTNHSHGEDVLYDFISTIIPHDEIIRSDRTVLDGRELDLYIPSKKLAIEYNGLFWHSEKFKPSDYHQKKSTECMKKGVNLFHIWEDDWEDERKQKILKKRILRSIGVLSERVFARKTRVVDVNQNIAKAFYDENHIQGSVHGVSTIGLVSGDRLVACMSFKRLKDDGEYDLVRYATSVAVVGGFTKLLSHFMRGKNIKRILTFASLDYSHGDLYMKSGFELSHITKPNYRYYNTRKTYTLSRHQCMKHKLSKVLDQFDVKKTEHENMREAGWLRVYDAGSLCFELKKTPQ